MRLAVMMYARFPLSLRQIEDLLNEQSTDQTKTILVRIGPAAPYRVAHLYTATVVNSHAAVGNAGSSTLWR